MPLLPLPLLLSLAVPPALASGVRLNDATIAELSSIEGVDASEAERIVALRERRGRLGSVETLRVLGFDENTLDALREGVVIDLEVRAEKGRRYNSVDEVMGEFVNEPDVRAVQAMAMAYTKTNAEVVEGWLSASRKAYALPKVNLQYEKSLPYGQDWDYDYTTGEAVRQLDQESADNNDKYTVKLEWKLDKLVMSSERIRVISEAQDVTKLRDKVLDEVTRLYFDRRRLQVDQLLNPPTDLKAQIEAELRYQELTANIDAFTGGAFSAALPGG